MDSFKDFLLGRSRRDADNDYEMGYQARSARWRPDRPGSSSYDRPNVSSSSRSAGWTYSSNRPRSPEYSSSRYGSSSRKSTREKEYGYIPIAYQPKSPPPRSRSRQRSSSKQVTPVYDRFDSDDAESDYTVHSSWSKHRRRTSEPDPDTKYGMKYVKYGNPIDQTERETSRYRGMRAMAGRPNQSSLLPLETVRRTSASRTTYTPSMGRSSSTGRSFSTGRSSSRPPYRSSDTAWNLYRHRY